MARKEEVSNQLKDILTQRELQIVQLLCEDLSYQEIATSLELSKRTISFHVSNMLHKTGYRSVVGLAVAAVRQRIDKQDCLIHLKEI